LPPPPRTHSPSRNRRELWVVLSRIDVDKEIAKVKKPWIFKEIKMLRSVRVNLEKIDVDKEIERLRKSRLPLINNNKLLHYKIPKLPKVEQSDQNSSTDPSTILRDAFSDSGTGAFDSRDGQKCADVSQQYQVVGEKVNPLTGFPFSFDVGLPGFDDYDGVKCDTTECDTPAFPKLAATTSTCQYCGITNSKMFIWQHIITAHQL
jgi:hypothetical protein